MTKSGRPPESSTLRALDTDDESGKDLFYHYYIG